MGDLLIWSHFLLLLYYFLLKINHKLNYFQIFILNDLFNFFILC